MGNENDIKDANQGGPAFDIPDLKKKEKERKKGGVPVGGGANPGAAGFQGAKAAASAAGSASSASSSILAGFASTLAGKAVLAGAAALVLGGGGLAVLGSLRGGGAQKAGDANLGGIESSIKVRTRRADRTTYLDHRGEVAFEAAKPAAKPGDAKPGEAKPGAAMPADTMENGTIGGVQDGENKDKLEHNLSGAKLSSSMGGSFGAKNVFAGNSAAPKFSDMSKSVLKAPGAGGRSTAMKQSRAGASSSRRAGRRISSNKAIGELRLVGGLSQQAATSATSEASAANATNAFEGQNTEGGVTPQADMPDTPPAVMGGGGGGGGGGGSGASISNNEQMLAMLAMMMRMGINLRMQGEKMKEYGKYMMIIGAVLLCTGEPISQCFGALLLGLGLMMDDMGEGLIKMGDDMMAGVKNQAAAQAAATGDTHQQNVTNYCADQALANGTDPDDCDPPEDIDHQQELSDLEQSEIEKQKKVDDTEITP